MALPQFHVALIGAVREPQLVPEQIDLAVAPRTRHSVIDFLQQTFAQRTQVQWIDFFADLDVCFAPVNNLRQGFDLAQTREREMLLVDDAGREHIGAPMKFLREPAHPDLVAPAHGEQTDSLLAGLGYSIEEIAALRSDGAVK